MTRYQQLADALAAEIRAERIAVGDRLPTEAALAREYDVSRYTVRAALRVLRDQGLITSRQGMGSRVRSAAPRIGYVEAMTSIDDVLEYAEATHLEDLKIEDVVADAPLSAELGTEVGRRWLRATGVRVANDEDATPICWADVYIDAALGSVRDKIPSHQHALFRLVEAETGKEPQEIRQEIAVASIPAGPATRLGAEPGAPALRVKRSYVDRAGRAFLVSISLHPADQYTHRAVLVRSTESLA